MSWGVCGRCAGRAPGRQAGPRGPRTPARRVGPASGLHSASNVAPERAGRHAAQTAPATAGVHRTVSADAQAAAARRPRWTCQTTGGSARVGAAMSRFTAPPSQWRGPPGSLRPPCRRSGWRRAATAHGRSDVDRAKSRRASARTAGPRALRASGAVRVGVASQQEVLRPRWGVSPPSCTARILHDDRLGGPGGKPHRGVRLALGDGPAGGYVMLNPPAPRDQVDPQGLQRLLGEATIDEEGPQEVGGDDPASTAPSRLRLGALKRPLAPRAERLALGPPLLPPCLVQRLPASVLHPLALRGDQGCQALLHSALALAVSPAARIKPAGAPSWTYA